MVAGRRATPPVCQPRPLLQNSWAPSHLLTPALTKINSQAASPGEEPGEWTAGPGALVGSQVFPAPSNRSCLRAPVSPRVRGERISPTGKPSKGPGQDPRAASDSEPSILRLTSPSSFSQQNHNILLPLNSSLTSHLSIFLKLLLTHIF